MCVRIITIALLLTVAVLAVEQVELTSNDCSRLEELPITESQREVICQKMRFGGGFESVYDLLDLGVFTPEEFERIKPLVSVGKVAAGQTPLDRIDSLYFRVGNWLTGESVSDEVVDEWIDAIRDRPVLSELSYRDLVGFQNVAPTDAIALMRHRKDIGIIKDRRQLRSVSGLSARGYVSVRSYIGYGEPAPISWLTGGYAQGRFGGNLGETEPYSTIKLRFNNGPISEGVRFSKGVGEGVKHDNWANPFDYPDAKFYAGLTRYQLGPLNIRHLVLGDYAVGFGEGITVNTGDYFSPRRSGTGFDIRRLGAYSDLSASQTYAFRGAALEFNWKSLEPTVFFSHRDKDAIYYGDSVFAGLLPGVTDWEDKVNETVLGGDFTVSPFLNLRLGVTGYYAKYDRVWDPYPGAIIDPEYLPNGGNPKVSEVDAELFYATSRQDYRSAVGLHGLWAIGNLALSAEYSEVVRDSNISFDWLTDGSIDTVRGDATSPLPFGDDPHALVAKAQLTTNRLNALALYRYYDLGFDNPYNRGFSEYTRYKGSLVEDDYRLVNTSYVSLAEDNPCPMAEEGLYLELYGRPFRQLSCTVEFDAFKRLSDMAEYRRIVLKSNWYANNNLTFRLWRKWQGRASENYLTPTSFTVDEIRLTAETRLSGYSRLGFTVIHSYLKNPPRPQFYSDADPLGSDIYEGSVVDPSDGVMLNAEVNVTEHLNISGQGIVYRGWLWNFEDNEFAELESETDAMRWWIAISDRLVENLSITTKLTIDTPLTATNLDIRDPYGSDESVIEGGNVRDTETYWRIQLDYFF